MKYFFASAALILIASSTSFSSPESFDRRHTTSPRGIEPSLIQDIRRHCEHSTRSWQDESLCYRDQLDQLIRRHSSPGGGRPHPGQPGGQTYTIQNSSRDYGIQVFCNGRDTVVSGHCTSSGHVDRRHWAYDVPVVGADGRNGWSCQGHRKWAPYTASVTCQRAR